jgi:hypothetical protein
MLKIFIYLLKNFKLKTIINAGCKNRLSLMKIKKLRLNIKENDMSYNMIRERRINVLKNKLKFSKDYLISKDYLKNE